MGEKGSWIEGAQAPNSVPAQARQADQSCFSGEGCVTGLKVKIASKEWTAFSLVNPFFLGGGAAHRN
jgi:hypothetical protein